jgi:GNAT superfamily N-acetyltransferase
MYNKKTPQGYSIQNTQSHHAQALDELQEIVFPTLAAEERMQAKHYLKHIELFPEGQFIILDGNKAIGMSSTIRYHLALNDHTFLEVSEGLWLTSHEPDGEWLYGMDVGVHPDYRGQGLARQIYRARQETCKLLGLKGQMTVGMPNGYMDFMDKYTLDEYYAEILRGAIHDPTVSVQQRMGFELVRLIHNYLDDPQCGNGGVMMILPVEKTV